MKRIKVNENISSHKPPNQSSSSSSSPVDKVASCDDLLTVILLRLPVRSLLLFMSVSKHCYFLVSSPSFKNLYSRNPYPPRGVFVPYITSNTHQQGYEFVSFDIENPEVKAPFKTLNFDPDFERIQIENSCNGLMLCSSKSNDGSKTKYYIYNPTISQFTTLLKLENYERDYGMTLAFDPSKSPHYRVICVCTLGIDGDTKEKIFRIEIYSSQTHTWKSSLAFLIGDKNINMYFAGGVYWNNAVHWLHHTGFILYFNLDNETLHRISIPSVFSNMKHEDDSRISRYIFESRDHLLVVELPRIFNIFFEIHELKRDYSGWFVKYTVDLLELCEAFFESYDYYSDRLMFVILSLVLGKKKMIRS